MENFFTTEQVANMLQVHPFTILKFIKEGKLKGVKLGRVYRIKESDVQEFLEHRTVANGKGGYKDPQGPQQDFRQDPRQDSRQDSKNPNDSQPSRGPQDPDGPPHYKLGAKKDDKDDEHYYII